MNQPDRFDIFPDDFPDDPDDWSQEIAADRAKRQREAGQKPGSPETWTDDQQQQYALCRAAYASLEDYSGLV